MLQGSFLSYFKYIDFYKCLVFMVLSVNTAFFDKWIRETPSDANKLFITLNAFK